jgi:hypothetical protein
MKAYGGSAIELHPILTWALHSGELQASSPLPQGNIPPVLAERRLGATLSGMEDINLPCRESKHRSKIFNSFAYLLYITTYLLCGAETLRITPTW